MSKTYIKNLLSINKKAFQFLHDVEGFDFEKPYFITKQAGKFTTNTVKKAVAEAMNPAACKISVEEPHKTYIDNIQQNPPLTM